MLDEAQIQELRDQHGDVREVLFETDEEELVQVVLRRPKADRDDPKKDEFFAFWSRRAAIEQTPNQVKDATLDGTAELLRCVLHPEPMALRKHLANYPADIEQLREAFLELAGQDAVADAPELVTDKVKDQFHRRALGFRVAGRELLARPMSGAEYATFVKRNGGRIYPMRAEALAWAAWSCVQELPDKDKRKPLWDALVSEVPMAAILLGIALLGLASSRVREREKKSMTPSLPPPESGPTESSAPAASSCTPLQVALEASMAAPAPSM